MIRVFRMKNDKGLVYVGSRLDKYCKMYKAPLYDYKGTITVLNATQDMSL